MEQERPDPAGPEAPRPGLSRRGLLGLLGAGAAGAGLGVAGGALAGAIGGTPGDGGGSARSFPFHGPHQAGITTPVQDHLHFAAFDLTRSATADDLRELLADWSYAAARLVQGLEVTPEGAVGGPPLLPPDDTGEAQGLPASGLTLTFGLGPTLFRGEDGADRLGLAHRQPALLEPLPLFAFDLIEKGISGGDLCIQACADDPQVAVHAIRNLSRIAFGRARIRWAQLGFGRTSTTTRAQATPRNLFGFKDGTANILAEDAAALEEFVWVGEESDQAWMRGGSYLVTRKIRMTIENWDRVRLQEQDEIIGRDKGEGAPLSGGGEFAPVDLALRSTTGGYVIPEDSHVRLAHPGTTGTRILRRGYNYVDGSTGIGQLDAGLFFISYQRSPAQFAAIQGSLAGDAMNEYIRHISSAVFAVPPGAPEGGSLAEGLFG